MGEERLVGGSEDDFLWCEISIAGGVAGMVCVLTLSHFFFLSFFLNQALFVSRYKKPYAARAMKRKKPIKANPPPASPLDGKNQTPRVHRKSLPRLAPKIIYPRDVRKQYIERYSYRDPNPSAGSQKQKTRWLF